MTSIWGMGQICQSNFWKSWVLKLHRSDLEEGSSLWKTNCSLVSAFFWEGAVHSVNTQSGYSHAVVNAQHCFMRHQAPFALKVIIEYRELKWSIISVLYATLLLPVPLHMEDAKSRRLAVQTCCFKLPASGWVYLRYCSQFKTARQRGVAS
jgi:hypothetical protein